MATTEMRDALAQAYADKAVSASLHTDDPDTTGAFEVLGGSPAYARVALTWGAPSDGTVVTSEVSINVPASTTVAYAGLWDAEGDFLDSVFIDTAFTAQGTLALTLTYTENP